MRVLKKKENLRKNRKPKQKPFVKLAKQSAALKTLTTTKAQMQRVQTSLHPRQKEMNPLMKKQRLLKRPLQTMMLHLLKETAWKLACRGTRSNKSF